MRAEELHRFYQRFKFGEETFHRLMKRRVHNVLLVSSVYDAYILEQDGRLSEQIMGEYRQLNLSQAPKVSIAPLGDDALDMLHDDVDMVIIMTHSDESDCYDLAAAIRRQVPDTPLQLLISRFPSPGETFRRGVFDDVFVWNGEATLFLAMIKSVEDRWNAANDTRRGLAPVIILAESDPMEYSVALPLLYTEIMQQTQALIELELNEMNKRLRMRARPKVLMTHTAEEARKLFEQYREAAIGVLVNVHIEGECTGMELIEHIVAGRHDLPVLAQGRDERCRDRAHELGAGFALLGQGRLLKTIRKFLRGSLGFGDFVFRTPDGAEIGRARTLRQFEKELTVLPQASLRYHGDRNDFSTWLLARGETLIARRLRPMRNTDFPDAEEHRAFLMHAFAEVRHRQNRGKIISFDALSLNDDDKIVRMGEGSLGGKGRGLAFLNALLVTMDFDNMFPDIAVRLPHTAIIGAAEFDWFVEHNKIREQADGKSDDELKRLFLDGSLSPGLRDRLALYVSAVYRPIAVRSSGLLEDSQSQPFAGVYATYMAPNNHPEATVRMAQLEQAVKLVFASPFLQDARSYIEGVNYDLDDEKMAVILQEIAGDEHSDGLFYPLFSGVAQSHNYYPLYTKHEEGVASLAAGLGKSVVDGGRVFRFCPAQPRVDMVKPTELVQNAQSEFYGLDLTCTEPEFLPGEDATLKKAYIAQDHLKGDLRPLTSEWDWQYQRFNDSEYARGPRALTFRNVTRYDRFPLPAILTAILDFGEVAHGAPVEIEFAVTLGAGGKPSAFHLLQIRPLTVRMEDVALDLDTLDEEKLALLSVQSLGNGVINGVGDIVWVDPDRFDNTRTPEIALEIEQANARLREEGRSCILIGPGRWGTSDRFLGVPVRWGQIDRARVIVEAGLPGFPVDASQGSHFFHNLVAMNIGYFTVPHEAPPSCIDWEWLRTQPRAFEGEYVVHSRLSAPVDVRMDGRRSVAAILRTSN